MPNPTKVIINCETGVQEEIELTDEEVAQREADAAAYAAAYAVQKAEQDAAAEAKAALKASAKAKLIAGQPLTAEEADVLVL